MVDQLLAQSTRLNATTAAALTIVEEQFNLTTKKLNEIISKFGQEMERGLKQDVNLNLNFNQDDKSFMPMIPTYVQHIPTGSETGTYLALDLGGTNLRVCEITLLGSSRWTMKQQKFKVSTTLKEGHASKLFDYIASSVDSFLTEIGTEVKEEDRLKLGFTFSFPVLQTQINKGTLINWTKGFKCPGAQGEDIVALLQTALDKQHIHVEVVSLVNDTAGTLMARAYESGECLAGGIFGTGTNGAYVERLDKITKMKSSGEKSANGLDLMIVNTEWGAFDNDREVLPFTSYDNRVDRISINPRKQAYEKMISGMYLGEITRNLIIHLVDLQVILGGRSTPVLNSHYGLDTATMSSLESITIPSSTASQDPLPVLMKALTQDLKLPAEGITESDAFAIARLSEIVSTRGARLSACAIAAVVLQVGVKEKYSFGLDGSLIEHLPRFEERMRVALREVLGEEVERKIEMGLAKDGSGVGAALCAHAAIKQSISKA